MCVAEERLDGWRGNDPDAPSGRQRALHRHLSLCLQALILAHGPAFLPCYSSCLHDWVEECLATADLPLPPHNRALALVLYGAMRLVAPPSWPLPPSRLCTLLELLEASTQAQQGEGEEEEWAGVRGAAVFALGSCLTAMPQSLTEPQHTALPQVQTAAGTSTRASLTPFSLCVSWLGSVCGVCCVLCCRPLVLC